MSRRAKELYTTPKICRCKNGEWFVFFRYWDASADKYKPFKRSEDLNRIKDPKEKEAEFKALRDARETWLKMGWNPITNTFPTRSEEEMDVETLKKMNFLQALDFAYKKKAVDWAKKTKQDYKSVVKFLKQGAAAIGINDIQITELKRVHYRTLLEKTKEVRELSAQGYNKYREYLSSLIGELLEYDILEYNPIEKIKAKDTIKTIAHREPTQDQRVLIVNRIRNQYRDYYRFIAVLYGCTIRPKEITALRIKNLHRLEQVFRMIPDHESSTKTKIEREVAIPDWVMALLMEMNLHAYDPEWYIFSTQNKYGSFLPGPNRMHSNTPTSWWRKIVKEDLKQDVNQYSLKKLSGNDMIRLQRREGVDKLLELPMQQMGHASSDMTEVYVTEHREIMKELVKRKMPIL